MFDAVINMITLFLRGRLFKDPKMVAIRASIGIGTGLVLLVVLVKLNLTLLAAIAVSALVSGALQPFLFRDLKYR
ncbi:MAG: hypothetical protein IT342_07405 [Candidatus Melainabacteria bacterium]|nr:hypothetical protein [Candidatus Melainabacteria bacterium]